MNSLRNKLFSSRINKPVSKQPSSSVNRSVLAPPTVTVTNVKGVMVQHVDPKTDHSVILNNSQNRSILKESALSRSATKDRSSSNLNGTLNKYSSARNTTTRTRQPPTTRTKVTGTRPETKE